VHAYLLTGKGSNVDQEATKISKSLGATLMEFPLTKIEDVRALLGYTKLSLTSPQAIYIKGIEEATPETQNAFLKSLEEPQKNLYYILTASSITKVLPTISSRCQVIRLVSQEASIDPDIARFSKMNLAERLVFIENIRKRESAINFLDGFISLRHQHLVKGRGNLVYPARDLKKAVSALNALKANGNVLLQLTNFVISVS
jgi:DNA polymerase III delta prime subunit